MNDGQHVARATPVKQARLTLLALVSFLASSGCGADGVDYVGTISRRTVLTQQGSSEQFRCDQITTLAITFVDDGTVRVSTDAIKTFLFRPQCSNLAPSHTLGGTHADGAFSLSATGKSGRIDGTFEGDVAQGSGDLQEETATGTQYDSIFFTAYR